jgi:hypothetical protein
MAAIDEIYYRRMDFADCKTPVSYKLGRYPINSRSPEEARSVAPGAG